MLDIVTVPVFAIKEAGIFAHRESWIHKHMVATVRQMLESREAQEFGEVRGILGFYVKATNNLVI